MGLRTQIAQTIASMVLANPKTHRAVLDLFVARGTMFFRDLDDHSVVFFPNDVIGRELARTGAFARQSVSDLRAKLEEHGVFQTGMTVLEVGANIGSHTIYFFRDLECGKVIALEPDPQNLRLLQHNMVLNGLSEKVTALALAASDMPGTALFTRDLINRGGSHLGGNAKTGAATETFSVEVVSIDALLTSIRQDPAQIGLIWMDVEGHELSALKGMKDLIGRNSPPIFLEHSPSGDDNRMQELRSLLFDAYEHVYVYSNGFRPLSADDFRGISHQVDLLAL